MIRRRGGTTVPGEDLSGLEKLDLIGITLLSNAGGRPCEVHDLGLRFDAIGVAVRKLDGEQVVQIPWVSLRRLETRLSTPKGRETRVELTVESDRKHHRFVVPNGNPQALRSSLGAVSARYAHPGLVADAKKPFRIR
jgi:hypothetical protein